MTLLDGLNDNVNRLVGSILTEVDGYIKMTIRAHLRRKFSFHGITPLNLPSLASIITAFPELEISNRGRN
jgi:hypothetical protein